MSTTFAVGDRVRKAVNHDWEGTVTAVLPSNLYEVDWEKWATFANNPYAVGELEPMPRESAIHPPPPKPRYPRPTFSTAIGKEDRLWLISVLATPEDRELPLQIELEDGYIEVGIDSDNPFGSKEDIYISFIPRRIDEVLP